MNENNEEKDLISSEDVLAVVSGDQVALTEQLERAKEVALEQLKDNHNISQEALAKKKMEEEAKQKKIEEEKRRVEERLQQKKAKQEQRRLAVEQKKLARENAKKAKIEAKKQRLLARQQEHEKKHLLKQEVEAQKLAQQQLLQAQEFERKKALEVQHLAEQKAQEQQAYRRQQQLLQQQETKEEESQKALEEQRLAEQRVREQQAYQQQILEQQRQAQHAKEIEQQKALEEQRLAEQKAQEQQAYQRQQQLLQEKQQEQKSDKKDVSKNTKQVKSDKKIDKKSTNNFKYYMTFIFLFGLILMVIFLPEISAFIDSYQKNKNQEVSSVVTTGTLSCTMTTNDDKYDYYYEIAFDFSDSKLYRMDFTTTIKGDRDLDSLELTEMKNNCQLLEEQVANLDGIRVSCSLSEGMYKNQQVLDYSVLKPDVITTAYLEAGGTYPNYEYQQNIDDIEKQMNASNYTCSRIK